MIILAFDVCSTTVSVAILRNRDVLYETIIEQGRQHSETLLPAIDEACRRTNLTLPKIDFLACTLGPGSFTGLRIGISTLKGLMMALEKPAAGVSSLAALAFNIKEKGKIIRPMMDAGRGQVYLASYEYLQNGFLNQVEDAQSISPELIKESPGQNVIYVGDGAVKYAGLLPSSIRQKIAPASQKQIRASSVGLLALENFDKGDLLSFETCLPFYLRSADIASPEKVGNI